MWDRATTLVIMLLLCYITACFIKTRTNTCLLSKKGGDVTQKRVVKAANVYLKRGNRSTVLIYVDFLADTDVKAQLLDYGYSVVSGKTTDDRTMMVFPCGAPEYQCPTGWLPIVGTDASLESVPNGNMSYDMNDCLSVCQKNSSGCRVMQWKATALESPRCAFTAAEDYEVAVTSDAVTCLKTSSKVTTNASTPDVVRAKLQELYQLFEATSDSFDSMPQVEDVEDVGSQMNAIIRTTKCRIDEEHKCTMDRVVSLLVDLGLLAWVGFGLKRQVLTDQNVLLGCVCTVMAIIVILRLVLDTDEATLGALGLVFGTLALIFTCLIRCQVVSCWG